MKRTFITAVLVALVVAATALAGSPTVRVTIRHQVQHCHAWSVNGNAYEAAQRVTLARGGSIVFQNNDMMPHKLVQVTGPKLALGRAANMNKMAATFKLSFAKAGVYRFKTVAGEDYMKGVVTKGEDNTLTLAVTVH
jgi:plastocyanin